MRKTLVFLIIITLIGLFFYSFRLKDTQVFTNDTARDTFKALQIWQNQELTLIGPPASFSLNTIREFYFGSLYLYVGILGLIAANWDPIGAVLPNTVLFTLSIPLFYKFISTQNKDDFKSFFATSLYALSPITVIHSRFFWNPNLIIPFSVLFWYLIVQKPKSRKMYIFNWLLAGVTAGIMFNFHYIAILPICIYLLILFFKNDRLKDLLVFLGFIIASLPFLIFELRNNFYLTQSFWFNIFSEKSIEQNQISILQIGDRLFNTFGAILGLRSAEIDYPSLFSHNPVFLITIASVLLGLVLLNVKEVKKIASTYLILLAVSLITTIYFSLNNKDLLIRYLFPIFPLLILLITSIVYIPKFKYLSLIFFVPVIYSSIGILYDDPKLGKSYLSLGQIELICQNIVGDTAEGRYNITENIHGDARAMAFRYCLNRDTKIKPQNELTYTDLSTLYVVSPSLEKTYQEKRWEFTASGSWRLVKTENIGPVNLYKFVK